MPADTNANKDSNKSVAANAPMRAPPMTMLKKAMVMASKKILNSSSGWGIERSVLGEGVVVAALAGEGLVAAALLVPDLAVSGLVVEVLLVAGEGLVVAALLALGLVSEAAPVLTGGEWSFGLAESAFEPG